MLSWLQVFEVVSDRHLNPAHCGLARIHVEDSVVSNVMDCSSCNGHSVSWVSLWVVTVMLLLLGAYG